MAYPSFLGSPFSTNTLDPGMNYSPKDGFDNKAVLGALYTISNARDIKIRRDSKNFLIQQLFEQGFEIRTPTAPRRITSKMLQQAVWRTADRMKAMDFEIFGTGRPEVNRRIVTAGMSTIMDKGNYTRSLRDKEGAFQKLLMWGDGFVHFGANPNPDAAFPMYYSSISNSNIYTDTYATGMRTGGLGRQVRKCAIIFSMSWANFCQMNPKGKKIAAPGRIPRDVGLLKELERSYLQTNKDYDIIEICYYYDLDNLAYVSFAGPTCAVLSESKGKNYPFTNGDNKDPYIPVLQFSCMPSTDGFYNHGLGDMLFDIAMFQSQLLNMGFNHIADNADPFTLLSVAKGETAKFFNSMRSAGEMRAAGKRPIIPMEYDPADPNSGRIGMEALTTQNMENELQAMLAELDKQILRLGVNLDDTSYGEGVTKYQIVAEQENQDKFVQQVQEYNASEYQFAIETAMDSTIKLVSSRDSTPLNLTEVLEDENGQQVKTDGITIGAVRDELKKYNYFCVVDARSGAQPSNTLEQARTEKLLAVAIPGSSAQSKLLATYAGLNGSSLTLKDFMPQQAPQAPAGPPPSTPTGDTGQGAPGAAQLPTAQAPQPTEAALA